MKEDIIVFGTWWFVWTIISAIVIHRFGWSWNLAFADASLLICIQALAGFVIGNTYRFYSPNAVHLIYRLIYVLSLAFIVITVFQWMMPLLIRDNEPYAQFLALSLPVRFVLTLLMISFLGVLYWLRYYIRDQKQHDKRKEEVETLLKDAELARLRQQLQPHFLFNSLNSISALAGRQPQEARKMIQQLSDFLRGTLKKDDQQLVQLEEELNHISLYLEIEKVRFGKRLSASIQCDGECKNLFLPSLLLQPIVENAIKFSLYDTTEEVTITIHARSESGNLHVSVNNPYDPASSGPHRGTGFGLSSIQRRLYLLYARNDLLITKSENRIFTTTLIIPQIK